MAKRSGKRKRWKDKGTPRTAPPPVASPVDGRSRLQAYRGRPKRTDVGPTPETAAKLRPDVLSELVTSRLMTQDEAASGREILDAWEIIVAEVDARGASWGDRIHGKSHRESYYAIWLQQVWRTWAAEVERRCGCPPAWVPEWITGKRYGHANLILRAVQWWEHVALSAGRRRATNRTSGAALQSSGPSGERLRVA